MSLAGSHSAGSLERGAARARIAVIGSGTRDTTLPPWLAEQAAAAGFEAVLVTPRLSAFAYTPYERLVVDLGYVDAMQSAIGDARCRAILINSFADYGIEPAQAAIDVPIIGAGEASIAAASASGTRRFSIVTVWPESMDFLYDERLRSCNAGAHCVSIRRIGTERELERLGSEDGVMQRMARHESPVVESLRRACEAAVREDGAEAIALGCTCMAPIGPELAARLEVPVYESSRTGLAAAIAVLSEHTGAAARAAQPRTARARRAQLVPQIVAGGLANLNSAEPESEAVCAPCAVLSRELSPT